MTEVWKPINNFIGYYEISNLGRIRSLSRNIVTSDNRCLYYKGKILSPTIDSHGYYSIGLYKNNIEHRKKIHKLVAEAFLEDYSKSLCVNHIDGIKTNNIVSNLEMCTYGENNLHAFRLGLKKPTILPGERGPRAKLTNKQAYEIRHLRFVNPYITYKEIAEKYNVSISTIGDIINNKRFKIEELSINPKYKHGCHLTLKEAQMIKEEYKMIKSNKELKLYQIRNLLSEKYHVSEYTIWNIVHNKGTNKYI